MNKKGIKNKKGFTLIELLSTIFVLGIVLVIATSSVVGIYNSIKRKALEEKIEVIEEAAILFGENRKENIIKSTSIYNDSPCKSFKLRELVPNYIENDTAEECINSDSENTVGCIVDPSDKNNYLDENEVIVFYKNKRIYSVVDINDELVCENTELTPEIKEFYLEAGKEETVNHTDVSAYLSWDTENIKYYCLIEENNTEKCIWNNVNGKSVTSEYTLTSGDGEKKVYAYIKDKYENLSEGKSYTINLDTTAPTGNSININDSEYTNSRDVTLTISSNGAKEMCISNTNTCNSWEEYKTTKEWILTSGDGEKTVYAWFRDEYGNTSEYIIDKITLDTSAPTNNSIKINGDDESTSSTNVALTLSSSGAKEMCVSNTSSCSSWETYTTSKNWTLTNGDGTKIVYVWYKDASGNTSEYVIDNITLSSVKVAQAIYSSSDNSLTFIKDRLYSVGETYNGKAVTAVYTGFETAVYSYSSGKVNSPWNEYASNIKSVIVKDEISPISTAYWFYKFENCSSFDLAKLNTSKVTNMLVMFYMAGSSANSLSITGLNNWDTSNVTNMGSMFADAGEYSTTFNIGDLSSWNTSNVTNMSAMFMYAGRKASTFNIGNLNNWNTSKVADMSAMFAYSGYDAKTFNIGRLDNWNTSKVTDMYRMFDGAGSSSTTFIIGDLSNWNVSNVTDMDSMFRFAGNSATTFNIGSLNNWNVSKVTSMNSMFERTGSKATTYNIGDLSKWDVSKVTDMEMMFTCAGEKATTFNIGNLGSWNTSNVTDMSAMFNSAGQKATTFNIGSLNNWNVSKVTNMSGMFCAAGEEATFNIGSLNNWDVSNVTDMSDMFFDTGRNSTTFNIGDLSKWNTSKVTNMLRMFEGAGSKATTFNIGNLGNWNVSKVTNMDSMFEYAGSWSNTYYIGNLSKWDVSNVTNMREMFLLACQAGNNCNIGDLSGWNTAKVTDMTSMFYGAGSSTAYTIVLNLSKWNVSKVTSYTDFNSGASYKITPPNFK